MSTTRKLLWLRHASADQARQLQAAVPSMDLEKASKSWWPRPSPGRTAATVITFDRLSRRNRIKVKSGSVAGRAPWLVAVLAHSGGFQGVLRALYDYKTSLVDTGRKRTPIFPQKTKNTRLEPCRLTG